DDAILGAGQSDGTDVAALLEADLRRGPLGLAEVVRDAGLAHGENLLLIVDQFEELFRFAEKINRKEADAFVALLLASVKQAEVPLYVILTMRSDFLGECALFAGLPEVLNDSQFLTPCLPRAQRQPAIEK